MRAALQRAWLGRGPLARSFLPLAWLYGAALKLRPRAAPVRLPVPVIVVGNVVAGGAGKTPVVIAIVEYLRARGWHPGVVSRGYGRVSADCVEVRADSDAEDAGDEPLLVKRRTGAPVFVAARRPEAAHALLAAHPAADVLVSDDGLQHAALARDIEICVFDERGIGNGWLLPAGPLREPWPRPVDLVLQHGSPYGITGMAMRRQLAAFAVRADGSRIGLDQLKDRAFTALAGIARPAVFFGMLAERGLAPAACVALPDHHDFASWTAPSGELVCTEKDAVKLWRTRPDAWSVPLEVEIDPAFWQALDRLLVAKLSSPNGPQTA